MSRLLARSAGGRRRSRVWPSALLLLALLPGVALAGLPPPRATVHPDVWEALAAEGEAEVLLILRDQADLGGAEALTTKEARGRYVVERLRQAAEIGQRDLRASLDAQGVEYQSFYIVNALKLRLDSTRLRTLARRSDVARIVSNPWVQAELPAPGESQDPNPGLQQPGAVAVEADQVEDNLVRVKADAAWALGYTGQGMVVAGQDTGYDWLHPALREQYRGWDGTQAKHDYNWHDAIHEDNPQTASGNPCGFDSPFPCDDSSHGTHTMGTMVGDDGGENQIGMAPGAKWIGCRNMEQGWGTPATYLECFEFFLAPYPVFCTPDDGDPAQAPHVVNNSWYCPPAEGCDAGALEGAVNALRQAGIVVVVSAGNSGSGCGTVSHPPAIYRSSFAVAAFNHLDDKLASFSSRGPAVYGGETYVKPELAAPGVAVRSSIPAAGYGTMSGTSMAAPHVAGAVALLLSAAPGLAGDVDAVEQALTHAAFPRTSSEGCGGDEPTAVPNNSWGWGILDVLAAVTSLTGGTLQGTVTNLTGETPIAGARLAATFVPAESEQGAARPTSAPGVALETVTGSTGAFTMTLPAGEYSVTAQAEGHSSQTATGVAVTHGQVTVLHFALEPLVYICLPWVEWAISLTEMRHEW